MGVFFEQTEIINRTSKPLSVRYDGQDFVLEPNYDESGALRKDVHNLIPTVTVSYAKSQNVLMGSEDPMDPSGYEVLVGIKAKKGEKQRDAIDYLEQSTELTRVRLADYLDDPSAKIVVAGRRVSSGEARPNTATTPFDVVPR